MCHRVSYYHMILLRRTGGLVPLSLHIIASGTLSFMIGFMNTSIQT